MVRRKERARRQQELRTLYKAGGQIGLVLGAGATIGSMVPGYLELVLRLWRLAQQRRLLGKVSGELSETIESLLASAEVDQKRQEQPKTDYPPPEEIAFLLMRQIRNHRPEVIRKLVKDALFAKVQSGGGKHKTVSPDTYRQNLTLNSIISFCAALPGSILARDSLDRRIEVNPGVAGIMTTNYDNLVEGAFGSKFGRSMLKPVGHAGSQDWKPGRRVIPVYHIHGYVSYAPPRARSRKLADSKLVIAEDDYFRVFSDPMGFGNYIGMSFLSRHTCLFIGSAMVDKNLRRFLYHRRIALGDVDNDRRHFAIMLRSGSSRPEYDDAVLAGYGVHAIWVDELCEIENILKEIYLSRPHVVAEEWDALMGFSYRSPMHVKGKRVCSGLRCQ